MRGQPITAEQWADAERRYATTDDHIDDIAGDLGVHRCWVYGHMTERKIRRTRGGAAANRARSRQRTRKQELAAHANRLRARIRRAETKLAATGKLPRHHGRTKITPADAVIVAKILARVNSGAGRRGRRPLKMEDVAAALGVHYNTLWGALQRIPPEVSWKPEAVVRAMPTAFRCECGARSATAVCPNGHRINAWIAA